MTQLNGLNDANAHFGVDTDDDGKVIARNYRVIRFTPNGKDELEKDFSKVETWLEMVTPDVAKEIEQLTYAREKAASWLKSKRTLPLMAENRFDYNKQYIHKLSDEERELVKLGLEAQDKAQYNIEFDEFDNKIKVFTGFSETKEEIQKSINDQLTALKLENKGVLADITTKPMHATFCERDEAGIDVGEYAWDAPGFLRSTEEQSKEYFNYSRIELKPITRKTKDTSAFPYEMAMDMKDKREEKFLELYAKILKAMGNRDFKAMHAMGQEINDVRDTSFHQKLIEQMRDLPKGLSIHQKALFFLFWNRESEARKRGSTAHLTPRERKIRDLFEDSRMLTFAQWKLLLKIRETATAGMKRGKRFMGIPTGIKGEEKPKAQPIKALKDVEKTYVLFRLEEYREQVVDLQAEIQRACQNLDGDALVMVDAKLTQKLNEVKGFMEAHKLVKGESL